MLSLLGCTAVLLTNALGDDSSYAARTMVDGLLQLDDVMDGVRAVRQMIILKFRGSDYLRGAHFFEIGNDGLRIYPRIEAMLAMPTKVPAASNERSAFGIRGLDEMMVGGVPEGTTTLVLGSSGTGKTILGMHFLAEGARRKEPGLYFGFFESPPRFLRKADDHRQGDGDRTPLRARAVRSDRRRHPAFGSARRHRCVQEARRVGVKTILLVDDEYAIVEVLAHLLIDEGYAVLTASNGREAMERVADKAPDLVVTDQMMPIMNGTELFRALKKDPALRQVPVILITSAPMRGSRELRWADYLSKPFEFEDLLRAVRRVLREA